MLGPVVCKPHVLVNNEVGHGTAPSNPGGHTWFVHQPGHTKGLE